MVCFILAQFATAQLLLRKFIYFKLTFINYAKKLTALFMKLIIMKLNVTQSPDSRHCVRVKGTSSGAGDTGESQSWSAKRRGTTLRPITKYCHNYTILYRPFHFLYPLLRLSLSFKHLQLLAIASDNGKNDKAFYFMLQSNSLNAL